MYLSLWRLQLTAPMHVLFGENFIFTKYIALVVLSVPLSIIDLLLFCNILHILQQQKVVKLNFTTKNYKILNIK